MRNQDEYWMGFAEQARTRANCIKRNVGAVLVKNNHLIATGYNGTSVGVPNCTEGGCDRCFNSVDYPSGRDYDLCVCVHAEENTILQSARFGVAIDGTFLYTTLKPCLSCLKGLVNAGIAAVYYGYEWTVPLEQKNSYDAMAKRLMYFEQYTAPEPIEEPWDSGKISTFG